MPNACMRPILGSSALFGLQGKIGLITGGAGSIGLASAQLLQSHGAKIVLVDRETDQLMAG